MSGGGYGGAPTTTVITSSKVVHTPDLPRPIELAVTRLVPGSDFEQPDLPVVNPFNDTVPHALIDSPSDIAHSPTHSLVAVTGFGSNNVLFAHPGNAWQPVGVADVGAGPRAAVFSDDGSALYVLNANALSISVVDVAPFLRESQQLPQHIAYSAASERAFGVDPLSPSLRNGRRVFANAHNAGLAAGQRFACVTCHPEGTQDGLVWVLPDGPRQTPSLTHRLEGTGPFNWHGTEDALQHNMAETIHRMGGLGLNCQELEDLEQFLLRGLPAPPPNPHVNDDGTLTPAQEAGQKLFFDETTACSECHSGATTTDGKLHDVGTSENQTRLNTPSLAGLYYTAPYLHDGSAADLFDVLEHTATTMGRTDHLTDDQKADLVAFLLTL